MELLKTNRSPIKLKTRTAFKERKMAARVFIYVSMVGERLALEVVKERGKK